MQSLSSLDSGTCISKTQTVSLPVHSLCMVALRLMNGFQ